MAAVNSCENGVLKSSVFKCEKCHKKVKNGIQCNSCESNYHNSCAFSGDDNLFVCKACGDESNPIPISEIRQQEILRKNLVLEGENAAYQRMYENLELKYQELLKENEALKYSLKLTTNSSITEDTNLDLQLSNLPSVTNSSFDKKMLAPVMLESDFSQQGHNHDKQEGRTQVPPQPVNPSISNKSKATHCDNNVLMSQQNGKPTAPLFSDVLSNAKVTKKSHEPKSLSGRNDSKIIKAPRKIFFGTAGNENEIDFFGIKRKAWFFVSRVHNQVSEENILNYLVKKTGKSIKDFSVEEIKKKDGIISPTKSFKISADYLLKDVLYDPSFWPENVSYRRYNFNFNNRRPSGDFLGQRIPPVINQNL